MTLPSKRMIEILSANPQDLARAYFELAEKPALPRLREIAIPTLVLVGDTDIPDVHAMQARLKLEYRERAVRWSRTWGTLCM
jgi:pimeloyl-ACP methyl ester carboxylesterase